MYKFGLSKSKTINMEENNQPPSKLESSQTPIKSGQVGQTAQTPPPRFKFPIILAIPLVLLILIIISGGSLLFASYIYSQNVPKILAAMFEKSGKMQKKEIIEKLTKNYWCTDTLKEPGHPDYSEYLFRTDGTFAYQGHSDVAFEPSTGPWSLEKSSKGYWLVTTRYKSNIGTTKTGKISTLPQDLNYINDKDIIAFNGDKLAIYPENTDFSIYVGINYYKDCGSRSTLPKTQPTPTPNPTDNPDSIRANWKTYKNTTFLYTFDYPSDFNLGTGQLNSAVLTIPDTDPYPIFYVDVIGSPCTNENTYNCDGFMNNLKEYVSIEIGTKVSPQNEPFNITFTKKSNIVVDGQTAYIFISSMGEKRIVIPKDKSYYVIGGYNSNERFDQILSTFKFTNQAGNLHEMVLGDQDNGTTVNVQLGSRIKVTLNSTYWNFNPPSDQNFLSQIGQPVYDSAPTGHTVPGSGAGTATIEYQALSKGHTTVSASRTSCGEAIRCTENQGSYTLNIIVN